MFGAFSLCVGVMQMKKIIYCPNCGNPTGIVESLSCMALPTKCNKCNKLVTYYGDTGNIKMSEVPSRESSSGKRFY